MSDFVCFKFTIMRWFYCIGQSDRQPVLLFVIPVTFIEAVVIDMGCTNHGMVNLLTHPDRVPCPVYCFRVVLEEVLQQLECCRLLRA